MDEFLFLLQAKVTDWPTIAVGILAGLIAWSWVSVPLMAAAGALAAELVIMAVRGWPIRPFFLAAGFLAALAWTVLAHAVRTLALSWLRPPPTGTA